MIVFERTAERLGEDIGFQPQLFISLCYGVEKGDVSTSPVVATGL